MGVYIPGMEMPTDNTVLIRVFPASENGECYVQQLDVDGDILSELWAVSVPPHGRLIDADALREVVKKHATPSDAWVFSLIRTAPTIIPAEEVYGQYTDTAGNFHWCGTHSGEHKIKAEEVKEP